MENYWKPQKDFLQLNPAGHLPVLVNEENFSVIGANACVEYIKDLELKPNLFVDDYSEKAEINAYPPCSINNWRGNERFKIES